VVRPATAVSAAIGLAVGWNVTNTGAVADELASALGVGLSFVGLLTTALFVVHAAVQVPAGRLIDRVGAHRVALGGIAVIVAANLVACIDSNRWLLLGARALAGAGTGPAFVAAVDYVRAAGGSSIVQGTFGGVNLAAGGVALAVVPVVETVLGWRSPFVTAAAAASAALLLIAPVRDPATPAAYRARPNRRGLFRDRRLRRLALLHAGSFGLNVVVANWVTALLVRSGSYTSSQAGALGALTLLSGLLTRPLGGWLLERRPSLTRPAIAASLVVGAAGTLTLALTASPAVAAVAATAVGLAGGLPFAPAFTGAGRARPDAPAAAAGVVNLTAVLVILVGVPLVGAAVSRPSHGDVGFLAVSAAWAACLLVLPSASDLGVVGSAERKPRGPSFLRRTYPDDASRDSSSSAAERRSRS
jgi:MFS transporter, NNP family, nitrate/nitrite transporter